MTDNPFDHQDLTRRTLLRRAGLAGGSMLTLPAILAACGDDDSGSSGDASGSSTTAASDESPELAKLLDSIKSKEVIIASYGGTTEDARKKAFWDPFAKRTGVKVIQTDADYAKAQTMMQGKAKAAWDCYHGSPEEIRTALQDGDAELPTVPDFAYEDLMPKEYQKYCFQSFWLAYVPAVIEGTFPDGNPKTWQDYFDVEKFPGKRIWPSVAYTPGTRESALMGDGVPPDQVYPMDLDRADAKIKSIFDDCKFYDEYPQIVTFMTSKTGTLPLAPNGIYKGAQDKGVKMEVLWDVTPIISPNTMSILPGAPNLDAVTALAAFCADPKRQAEFARLTNYGPPSKAAFDELTDEEKANLPNSPGRTVLEVDVEYLGEHGAEIQKRNQKLFAS
jgi:putative spermidine/putrescine transport system substrate-binding protein